MAGREEDGDELDGSSDTRRRIEEAALVLLRHPDLRDKALFLEAFRALAAKVTPRLDSE